jgi:hypothetical protein
MTYDNAHLFGECNLNVVQMSRILSKICPDLRLDLSLSYVYRGGDLIRLKVVGVPLVEFTLS